MDIYWKIVPFHGLDISELYQIIFLREQVFVVEQNCVYQDVDGKDLSSHHVIAFDNAKPIAYCRIYFENASTHIGRVVVGRNYRGKGLAYELMNRAHEFIRRSEKYPNTINLSAQKYLVGFYQNIGYHQIGEPYLEDGIPHVAMIKSIG